MTPIIKITDGVTRHPAWRMAEPVNMEILPGEQIAICGDNAAGKSRLVEIITGSHTTKFGLWSCRLRAICSMISEE